MVTARNGCELQCRTKGKIRSLKHTNLNALVPRTWWKIRMRILLAGLLLLCAAIVASTLLSGCAWFGPDITDNTEPTLKEAFDDGDSGTAKESRK